MMNKKLWITSMLVTLLLSGWLIKLWSDMNQYQLRPDQLTNEYDVTSLLNKKLPNLVHSGVIKIPTGIFIQAFDFTNSSDVHLNGAFWQRFTNERYQRMLNQGLTPGITFPEGIEAGTTNRVTQAYHVEENGEHILGWYFDITIRQPFNYDKYPFDHKTVWLRLWPKDFYKNVILVPDFKAYNSTEDSTIFGIDNNIVTGSWSRENTFFNYQHYKFDHNFGVASNTNQHNTLELRYNFVLKRKFQNAFIVNLLPLFVVATLLFASLLTISRDKKLIPVLGNTISGFINTVSALFFVILLAHIQLRQKFECGTIVYLEYFYILMYLVLILATINVYLFHVQVCWISSFFSYRDNIIPKIMFWPGILITMIIITYGVLLIT